MGQSYAGVTRGCWFLRWSVKDSLFRHDRVPPYKPEPVVRLHRPFALGANFQASCEVKLNLADFRARDREPAAIVRKPAFRDELVPLFPVALPGVQLEC